MPESYRQRAMNQRTNIPQGIQQAMQQHAQTAVPAHLRKYMDPGHSTYVPQAAQKQIAQAMEKSMPAHLKQYAGAYVEQNIAMPNSARPTVARPGTTFQPAPTPDKMRLDHSAYASQYSVDPTAVSSNAANLFQTDAPAAAPGQPAAQTPAPAAQPAPYDFIMNPAQPPKQRRLPGGNGPLGKSLAIAGGIFALLIVFVVLKSLLGGGANLQAFVGVAQDQQELIHLLNAASQQQDLSVDNQNFVATAQLGLGTAQQQLTQYLTKNHQKVTAKQLALKVSKSTDDQLAAAATAGTYNQTFKDVITAKLAAYRNDLKQTYQTHNGKVGRSLLSADFDQAQLLLTQAETASAAAN